MSVDWEKIQTMPESYHVIVRDNYHYQDEDEAYVITGFVTEAEALAKCQEIVERDLARIIHPVEFGAPSFEHLASAGHS